LLLSSPTRRKRFQETGGLGELAVAEGEVAAGEGHPMKPRGAVIDHRLDGVFEPFEDDGLAGRPRVSASESMSSAAISTSLNIRHRPPTFGECGTADRRAVRTAAGIPHSRRSTEYIHGERACWRRRGRTDVDRSMEEAAAGAMTRMR